MASYLKENSCLVLERGEYRSIDEALSYYDDQVGLDVPYWEKAHSAFKSKHAFNNTYALAENIFSQFEFISGGTSNRWDGYSVRPQPYVFKEETESGLKSQFKYSDIEKYYTLS